MPSENFESEVVVVNATALDKSGALTILKQFVNHASQDKTNHYLCFIPCNVDFEITDNITFIKKAKMGWLSRIVWDSAGLKKYINNNGLIVKKIISLQNTSVNFDCEQIIYLHQPLPFSNIKWSLFKKDEAIFFLYKHFYKFFIFLFSTKNTQYVVQTEWMKGVLSSDCKINSNNIFVIKPDIKLPSTSHKQKEGAAYGHVLLYPATPLVYKNHDVILDALKILKSENRIDGIKFQVTFKGEEYPLFKNKVNRLGLSNNIDYLGTISYSELVQKYENASIVLFPSYIETFGLPLAEGATLNKPILCSDLPFSRDVLHGYLGATYLDYQDPLGWANAIKKTLKEIDSNSLDCGNFEFKQSSSWKDFFKLI